MPNSSSLADRQFLSPLFRSLAYSIYHFSQRRRYDVTLKLLDVYWALLPKIPPNEIEGAQGVLMSIGDLHLPKELQQAWAEFKKYSPPTRDLYLLAIWLFPASLLFNEASEIVLEAVRQRVLRRFDCFSLSLQVAAAKAGRIRVDLIFQSAVATRMIMPNIEQAMREDSNSAIQPSLESPSVSRELHRAPPKIRNLVYFHDYQSEAPILSRVELENLEAILHEYRDLKFGIKKSK